MSGKPEVARDPLTEHVLAFEEADLASTVAALLAAGGYIAMRVVPRPPGEFVQVVATEEEALVISNLLAELRLHRRQMEAAVTRN